jgi:peptidoglycan/xylan/chitin deacetylase (PgdA/CDA1 family)
MTILQSVKNFIKKTVPDSLLTYRLKKKATNSILLTFDDGPDENITPLVLERLAQFNARAIFFVVGKKIEKNPKLFDMIVSQGHMIGNHTCSHPNQIMTSAKEYQKELLLCDQIIANQGVRKPQCIRPPLGLSFANLRVALLNKRKILLWSIEGGEWGVHKQDSTEIIIARLKKYLRPRDILLLHDNNPKIPKILDSILPFLKQKKIDLTGGTDLLI